MHNSPMSGSHYLLPLPGNKYAPRSLTFKGKEQELIHFLEVYDRLCAHYKVTDNKERCKGIPAYCAPKIARMVRKLPSYVQGNYPKLVKDLYYFLKDEDVTYSLSKVEKFTRKWRKRKIETSEQFKRYHRKYLEIVGEAVGTYNMSDRDCNRYFWEGIHHTLRKRIDDRLSVLDPDLDVSVPFEMEDIVKAAAHLFNRKHFDQHLIRRSAEDSSDSETNEEDYKPSHVFSDSEDDKENDSGEESEAPKRKRQRKKVHHREQKSQPKKEHLPPRKEPSHPRREPLQRKAQEDEVTQLTQQMNELKLYVMRNESGPRNQQEQSQTRYPRNPNMSSNPHVRDPPPHQPMNPNPRPMPEYCFACGTNGHRMGQCRELNSLTSQGLVVRNGIGRIQWPDGSPIYKDREETFLHAINRNLKRTNVVKAEVNILDTGEVYPYVGAVREEDDASSEEQEELGWSSGFIGDCYALGAERNPRVSRDTRRQIQDNPPSSAQGVKKFPEHRNAIGAGRQGPIINHGPNFNSNQPGVPKRITPTDVHQRKFEGKTDDQFIPMEIDQIPVKELGKEGRQIPPNRNKSEVTKVANPGTRTGRSTSEMVQQIMHMPLTVTVEEAIGMSPALRRDLMNASRPVREVSSQTQEKTGKNEKSALGVNLSQPLEGKYGPYVLGEPREDLLTVKALVGRARMLGVFDCGSQINILSDKLARICGLPINSEGAERYRITGVNGEPARCLGVIPPSRIYLTDSELETVGDLVVVENAGFDLLLGRPWGTTNGAGLREAPEGTYLSFDSLGGRFEVNASPNLKHRKRDSDRETSARNQRVAVLNEEEYRVAAVSHVSETQISDSEPEQNIPQEVEEPDEPEDQEQEPGNEPENPEVRPNVPTDQHSDSEHNEEEEILQFPPLSGLQEGEPSSSMKKVKSTQIRLDLRETYIQMVQQGENDAEWDRFCEEEKERLAQDSNEWKKWKHSRKQPNSTEDTQPENENLSESADEPSATLATEALEEPSPRKRRKESEETNKSAVTALRRSHRARRESHRARESDDWQAMKYRAYERRTKLTRKIVQNSSAAQPTDVQSLGVRLEAILLTQDTENTDKQNIDISKKHIKNSTNESKDSSSFTPTSILPHENPSQPSTNMHHYRQLREAEVRTYQVGEDLRLRELPTPRRADLAPRDPVITPFDRGPEKWYLGPGLETFDENQEYPWVSRGEMRQLISWTEKVMGKNLQHVYIHAIDSERIAIVVVAEKYDGEIPLGELDKQRILVVWRNEEGELTGHTCHTAECATEALKNTPDSCQCSMDDKPLISFIEEKKPDDDRTHRSRDPPPIKEHSKEDEQTPEDHLPKIPPKSRGALRPVKNTYTSIVKPANEEDYRKFTEKRRIRIRSGPKVKKSVEEKKSVNGAGTQESSEEDELPRSLPLTNDWCREMREMKKKIPYRLGDSLYFRKIPVGPPTNSVDTQARPFNEVPEKETILTLDGLHGGIDHNPELTREEIRSIIDWCDHFPGNEEGGRHFLIFQTIEGSIGLMLIGKKSDKHPCYPGQMLLEITRRNNGELYEIWDRMTVSQDYFINWRRTRMREALWGDDFPPKRPILSTPSHADPAIHNNRPRPQDPSQPSTTTPNTTTTNPLACFAAR